MAVPSGAGSAEFAVPDALPVLPLRDAVVLPLTAVPLAVGQPRSVRPLDGGVGEELLGLDPVRAKLRRLADLLQRHLAGRELGRKITTATEARLSKTPREYYVREQLRSIQRELGEDEGGDSQVAD